jgi:hypothetical protein
MKNNLLEESFLGRIYFRYFKNKKFSASDEFWEKRYQKGKDSGSVLTIAWLNLRLK